MSGRLRYLEIPTTLTMKTAPAWVDRTLYPFQSKWIKLDEIELHYIDEGHGEVILFVHGTPEWSFAYRNVILELRKDFRCVALDLMGFGLSDKPPGEDYSCKGHAVRLEHFIDRLGLSHITIVGNDFGGGILLHYAVAHVDRIRAIVLTNTWCWSLANDPHYARPARMMRGWLGRFMYLRLNFPVKIILPAAYGDRKKLRPAIHNHYKKALPDISSRMGAYAFSKELMDASGWWEQVRGRLGVLGEVPKLILWGLADRFVPSYELQKWIAEFPGVRVVTFETAGHFLHEEEPERMAEEIRALLATSSTR